MRLRAFSAAAAVKLVNVRTTPSACGSSVVAVNRLASPNWLRMIPAQAAAKVAWPDTHAGKQGLKCTPARFADSGCQFASCTVAGLLSVCASRIADWGRHRSIEVRY